MTNIHAGDALTSPSVARNRDPILDVLRRFLPEEGLVLEIASGTGEHAVWFAQALPHLAWQPTDRDPRALLSIEAHRRADGPANLLTSLELDVTEPAWPVGAAAAIVAINMIHIAPWSAARGLMAGAERVLRPGGVLYLYGPYIEEGRHTAPSNAAFDADLRARNPEWGVRDLADVRRLAEEHGLELVERIPMPANNVSLVFRREDAQLRETV